MEMGSVGLRRYLFIFLSRLHTEHLFPPTEGVIINQGPEHTVGFGHFVSLKPPYGWSV